jgi:hypothetical protein
MLVESNRMIDEAAAVAGAITDKRLKVIALLAVLRAQAAAGDDTAALRTASRVGTPVALFLCTHNAGRSQMALGFFAHLAGDRAIAWSGGSDPAGR